MAQFAWNDTYSVNVKRFDEDHQRLFDIINELHEGMKARRGKEILHGILGKLLSYTEQHFTREEAALKSTGYPQLTDQIQQHRMFTDKIKDLTAQHKAGAAGLSIEVTDFLTEWLSKHIMRSDRQYSEFLNAKGVA
jgi:hemerythrin